jgi:hypothetical protein
MSFLAMALPVPPGKSSDIEQHIAEAQMHNDFDQTLRGFGIQHESWHLQETPGGDLLILVFQCDDPPAMLQAFGESQAPLPIMQRKFIKENLGIDLSQPPPGPPPRALFSWDA